MAIREIVWTVADNGKTIHPTAPQDGGVQGEHNATRAVWRVGEDSVWETPTFKVYVECEDNAGNVDHTEPLQVEGGQISVLLPQAWTQYGGISTLRLVAEEEGGVVAYLVEGYARFSSRQNASKKVDGLMKGRLAQMEAQMREAVESAEAASERAEVASESAVDAAQSAATFRTGANYFATQAEKSSETAVAAMEAAKQSAEKAAESAAKAAENAAGGSSNMLVVTYEGGSRDSTNYTSGDIYSHIANGGTAVFFAGNQYSNLTMCEPNEAVFCRVLDDNTIYRYVVDSNAGFEEQEIYIPHSDGGGGGTAEYNRINVRDYGAVGDGVTDDRQAIIAAFEAAKSMLPCEVYFPAGTYGISNGITVEMAYGTGGLLVRGAGRDITTIKYLDSYNPDQAGNMWYAIRIWPDGMQRKPQVTPATEDEWLHDVSYTGLTVYDPNPCAHAWHTAKGDPSNEETHGVDIHYCKGLSVTDCQFITVGDEAIDICNCHDVVVMNNRLVGSPGAGPGGGAISIGDGCKGVVVCGNTVNGCAPDETLDDGTVIKKSNYGIAVESLFVPVQDVTITGNTILNMHGKGINLGATNEGAGITNVIIADNVIRSCDLGIRLSGVLPKDNVKITNNLICDCLEQAVWTSKAVNLTICGNTIRNIKGDYALYTATYGGDSRQFIADNVFENIEYGAVYCNGNVVLKDCVFNGLGTAETAPTTATYGVYRTGGTLTVSGCVFKDVRMAVLKTCLQDVDYIDNTDVEVVNKTTGVVDGGGASVSGTAVKRIIGCSLIGRIDIKQDNAIVQGTKITYKGSAHAVTVSANGVAITGCIILADNGSYRAISEASGYNHNMISNNVANKGIVVSGAQSVAVNNIDTRVTE